MGILKRAADITYAFRFVRLLVMKWENWDAYKLGIIDKDGKRDRNIKLDDDEKKSAYTPFIRLVANIKRLTSKIPGGGTGLGSFASALYLIKEEIGLNEKQLTKIVEECNLEILDFLNESNMWFILDDKCLSPGVYKLKEDKLLNKSCEDIVFKNDQIRIKEDSYPVGNMFGLDIYEALHIKTGQKVFVSTSEIIK
tara:strand:- start:1207 stop:1794 length:588 start_codon:yes stop_codon:yes gene_type:complete